MTPEHELRITNEVLRDVLWGSEKNDVMHKLEVNGITGEHAEILFGNARKERLSIIRSESLRKAIKGLVVFLAGVALIVFFAVAGKGITRGIFITCFVAWTFGGYWLIDGAVAAVFAASKKGSVVDEG